MPSLKRTRLKQNAYCLNQTFLLRMSGAGGLCQEVGLCEMGVSMKGMETPHLVVATKAGGTHITEMHSCCFKMYHWFSIELYFYAAGSKHQ